MTSMRGKLWDRADLLAGLGGVRASSAATEVPAGAADQLVRAAAAEEQVVGRPSVQVVARWTPDQDVNSAAAGDRIRSASAIQQVGLGAADQPVATRTA